MAADRGRWARFGERRRGRRAARRRVEPRGRGGALCRYPPPGGHGPAVRIVAAEALGAAPDAVFASELSAHDPLEAGAGPAAGLLGDLQADAREADRVVW